MSSTGLSGAAPLPPAALSQDREFINAMRALQSQKRWSAGLVLIVSLALFIFVRQQQSASSQGLLVLLSVLLLHESGHYLGMRLFGYRDVRMFFIPFFGAAVSGKRGAVAPWKEGVVLLLGPLPGIALAFALASGHAIDSYTARQVALSLVTITASTCCRWPASTERACCSTSSSRAAAGWRFCSSCAPRSRWRRSRSRRRCGPSSRWST